MGYSERDNAFYRSWDEVSRDRDSFISWIDKHVKGTTDFDEYCRSAGITQGATRV
jgi:glutaconate CoA-transferase subunit A